MANTKIVFLTSPRDAADGGVVTLTRYDRTPHLVEITVENSDEDVAFVDVNLRDLKELVESMEA